MTDLLKELGNRKEALMKALEKKDWPMVRLWQRVIEMLESQLKKRGLKIR